MRTPPPSFFTPLRAYLGDMVIPKLYMCRCMLRKSDMQFRICYRRTDTECETANARKKFTGTQFSYISLNFDSAASKYKRIKFKFKLKLAMVAATACYMPKLGPRWSQCRDGDAADRASHSSSK